MCFSAPVSFIASGGLAVLGGSSLIIAKKEDKILALIPLLFAFQQGFEGVQWLYLNHGSSSLIAGYGFLFFAFLLWPIYVPAFVYLLDEKVRRTVRWFVLLGAIIAVYFLTVLATTPLSIQEYNLCVKYTFYSPLKDIISGAYLLVVFVPLLISTNRIFQRFGIAIIFLAIIAWLFFTVTFASVWCFFAAVISSMFFFYIRAKKHASIKDHK